MENLIDVAYLALAAAQSMYNLRRKDRINDPTADTINAEFDALKRLAVARSNYCAAIGLILNADEDPSPLSARRRASDMEGGICPP